MPSGGRRAVAVERAGASCFAQVMRALLLALLLPLAACSGGGDGNNSSDAGGEEAAANASPAPRPTGPAPRTPVLNVQDSASNDTEWLDPQAAPDAPRTAPYGNLLDDPVVKGPPAQ